jgi:hypothetical protein
MPSLVKLTARASEENEAYLDRQSGKIYWHSEFGDNDEELPDTPQSRTGESSILASLWSWPSFAHPSARYHWGG